MDKFVSSFDAVEDRDLMLCERQGVAYQRDMSASVEYDGAYFDKYVGYEGSQIALAINSGRVRIVNEIAGKTRPVLDVGIGSGEFIKSRENTFGFDINAKAEAWLKSEGKWSDRFELFRAFTFWDVIEHVPTPDDYFRRMTNGSLFFTCLPIFGDLNRVRESKHYRPNEHYYYWTEKGFVEWMALHSFVIVARRDFETAAGRENIVTFAFQRRLA